MKYRSYRVRLKRDHWSKDYMLMSEFLNHVNDRQEKIMHVIPFGTDGWFVDIITLGQDDG